MLRGRTTMEGHAKKCVERYCELANKTEQLNCTKSQLLAWMAKKNFKKDELESVRILSKVCSQIVLRCLYLARIGRPDIHWSVNKLARSVTNWNRACDRRFARLISYIRTNDYRHYCNVGNTAQHCRLGLFQDSDLARLRRLKINHGENLMYVRKPNICTHKLDVQETNVCVSQFHRIGSYFVGCWSAGHCMRNSNTKFKKGNRDVDELSNVDYVVTNENCSQAESQLYIFERCPGKIEAQPKVFNNFIPDKTNFTCMIEVAGIDMTKNELANNLGMIDEEVPVWSVAVTDRAPRAWTCTNCHGGGKPFERPLDYSYRRRRPVHRETDHEWHVGQRRDIKQARRLPRSTLCRTVWR